MPFSRLAVLAFVSASAALAQTNRILDLVRPAEPTPLTQQQRFKLYVLNTAGPVPILGEAASAGLQQWANSPPEWHQGWGAFGKRFANNLAYNGIRQSIAYGASTALREDGRYFASHEQGVWRRTRHALLSTVTARRADGGQQFSVSNTASVVGAAAISSLWGPPSWQGPGNVAKNAGISFAATAGFNIVREFLFPVR